MTVTCGTIRVWVPTNITATDIVIEPTDCDEPCESTVTVTWTNVGGRTATFTPAIVVDGVRTEGTPVELAQNQTTIQVFTVTGLTAGEYTVCPDPN